MPLPGLRTVACVLAGVALALSLAEIGLAELVGPEAALLERVNRVRREHHLRELGGSSDLARVAVGHAREMAQLGYLSHTNSQGQDPLSRVQAAGITGFRLLAENIGSSDVSGDRLEAVVREWLRSPLHRENLLNPAFNTTGLAVVDSPGGATLFVQLFATY